MSMTSTASAISTVPAGRPCSASATARRGQRGDQGAARPRRPSAIATHSPAIRWSELTEIVAAALRRHAQAHGIRHRRFRGGRILPQDRAAVSCRPRRDEPAPLHLPRNAPGTAIRWARCRSPAFKARRDPFEGALVEASLLSPVNAYRPPRMCGRRTWPPTAPSELEQEILRLGAGEGGRLHLRASGRRGRRRGAGALGLCQAGARDLRPPRRADDRRRGDVRRRALRHLARAGA